jgi:hypothetical protein
MLQKQVLVFEIKIDFDKNKPQEQLAKHIYFFKDKA